MTGRAPEEKDTDRLLREALADDLPPDVEGRLRTAMRSSWSRASASAGEVPGGLRPLRPVLGVAAVLMVAVGWVVHLEADAGPRAESFMAQQAAARVAAQLHRVPAMECHLEARDSQGRALHFAIDWRDTGETTVRFEGPEGSRHRTFEVPGETVNVLALSREKPAPPQSPPDDPAFEPARAHLTPERLASLLVGRWELIPDPDDTPSGVATFRVSRPGGQGAARVTIDTTTFLPLSVEQAPERAGSTTEAWTRARFVWPRTPPSPRLLGDHSRLAHRPAVSWS